MFDTDAAEEPAYIRNADLPPLTVHRAAGLAVRTAGAGPALILVHGGGGSWLHWIRNIGPFSAHFTVHAIDQPGFGDSPDIPPETDLDGFLDMMCAAVDELCPDETPFSLVGFSFGGMLAAGMAARFGDRVRRVSLLAPGGFGAHKGGAPLEIRQRRRDMTREEILEVYRHNAGKIMLSKPPAFEDDAFAIYRDCLDRSRFKRGYIRESDRTRGFLAGFDAPLQLVWGEYDRNAWPSYADRLEACRAVRPDLDFAFVEKAGHWTQYEGAEAYNRAVLDFLTREAG